MPGHHIVFFIVIHSAVSGFVVNEISVREAHIIVCAYKLYRPR